MMAVFTIGIGVVEQTKVGVSVVIVVVYIVYINGVIGCQQQSDAFVLVGVVFTIFVPTAFVIPFL